MFTDQSAADPNREAGHLLVFTIPQERILKQFGVEKMFVPFTRTMAEPRMVREFFYRGSSVTLKPN